MWIKMFFHFIYDYYRTLTDLENAIYFILFERSEVKLFVFKNPLREEKLRKSCFKLELRLMK